MNKEQYFGSLSLAELAAIQTAEASEKIAEHGAFDSFAGELIMRNLYVLTDRLTVADYATLSESTKTEIEEVARYARLYLPLDADEIIRSSYDDAITGHYRANIQSPLHKLQKALYTNNIDTTTPLRSSMVQDVVSTAGQAFAHALGEVETLPAIEETQVYFNDNANAALNRLTSMQSEPYFSNKNISL